MRQRITQSIIPCQLLFMTILKRYAIKLGYGLPKLHGLPPGLT